jgi:DNA-binding NarL/FixJ family response regulator
VECLYFGREGLFNLTILWDLHVNMKGSKMPTLESINNLKSKESEICDLYINGESSNKIAQKLKLSKSSVKKILKKI